MKVKQKSFCRKIKTLSPLVCFGLTVCATFIFYAAPLRNKRSAGTQCGERQYRSDFLSGGCTECPRLLEECEAQEIGDADRCFIVCSRILSPMTSSVPKSSTSVAVAIIEFPDRNNTTDSPKKIHIAPNSPKSSSNELLGNNNSADIILGVVITILALLILAVCFAFWRWRIRYANYNPAGEQYIHGEAGTGHDVDRERNNSFFGRRISSVSQTNFDRMSEANV